jgi:hypothetical protein
MATGRRLLRDAPGLGFARLLGTGHGRTFTATDADLGHWAVLTVWAADAEPTDPAGGAADRYLAGHRLLDSWDRIAHERLDVRLEPLASRGRWAGQEPFGTPTARRASGPVASVTRARIRPREWGQFWRSGPPVAVDLHQVPGLRLAFGIGEAPVGWQGTFSLWDSPGDLTRFAHRRDPHRDAIRATAQRQWYAEELFARFSVRAVDGRYGGRAVTLPTPADQP